ncbi:MAG: hypothetical protein RI988_2675 [Pseudomonadota bacterium]|jgi:prevent-host-death family protein
MSWNIANAKQQFSELVRLCAEEPQPVFNRSRQVAVVVSAEEFAAFEAWRKARQAPAVLGVAGLFGEARSALRELGAEGLELPARTDRPGVEFGPEAGPEAEAGSEPHTHTAHAAQ